MKRILLMTVAFSAIGANAVGPHTTAVQAFQDATYGDCGFSTSDLTAACRFYHPSSVGLVGTAYCLGEDCFDMNYGDHIRVVAGDDSGAFPDKWFAWPDEAPLDNTYPGIPCLLDQNKNTTKTQITFPGTYRCKAEQRIAPFLYHEHFASNPMTRCLGWLECREDLP